MSASTRGTPTVKRVRAFFAPVNRVTHQATIFDPAQQGSFALDAPPSPWVDLGWVHAFERKSTTNIAAVMAGAPSSAQMQVRKESGAELRFTFESWGKLQMLLTAGTQQMNLLAVQAGSTMAGAGGSAVPPVTPGAASTATSLVLGDAAAGFTAGQMVAVDVDYVPGTTGFVGSGVSGAYAQAGITDVDYIRRITLNVGRVMNVASGVVTLEAPLLAGAPTAAMKVSAVLGVCDREGSRFFQEWSGLFIAEGQQGERVIWYYPRLQSAVGIAEETQKSPGGYQALRVKASFRALPVADGLDGETVVCYRSLVSF